MFTIRLLLIGCNYVKLYSKPEEKIQQGVANIHDNLDKDET